MTTQRRIGETTLHALLGVSLLMLIAGFAKLSAPRMHTIDMRGMVAEAGGWGPASFAAQVGEPVQIRLTSGDVQHGFAIGQMELPAADVMPGQMSEMTVTFDRPGKYVFYCTHWCSPGHWRMRGTIEVLAANPQGEGFADTNPPPLYVQLGLNIDAPHAAAVSPTARPSAARGAALGVSIPAEYQTSSYYRSHSPAQLWQALRALPVTAQLSDAEVWDLVANAWETNTTAQALATGKQLFTANCAACHGERGAGDGPMAFALSGQSTGALTPTNFTNATMMFGASPALLQGKISRGGMGTGMPYWGPIFNDVQVRAIVDFLWTFQMDYQAKP